MVLEDDSHVFSCKALQASLYEKSKLTEQIRDKDQLGTLNLLTPEVVANAAKEIKTGHRVSLDWQMTMPSVPMFSRQAFVHEIRNKAPRTVNDDVLHFNTQCSTQWDGLRHYGLYPDFPPVSPNH